MSKELTPLEHLEFIRNYEIDDEHRTLNMNYATKQSLDLIETALKRLETLEEEKQSFDRQLEKKLKALEIIKEKKVDIQLLFDLFEDNRNDYQDYNENNEHRWLKKKEYELLKEVLL